MSDDFWYHLELLLAEEQLVVDRPKGSHHPRYPDIIYPLDYGYLEGTMSADGGGIDIWVGSLPFRKLTGIACTYDTWKRDAEIKLLVGCSEEDIQTILKFHSVGMKAIFVRKPDKGVMK